jgi:hypothetical protein
MLIPYGLIGEGIALLLSILAFIKAEDKGRILLVTLWGLSFLLPIIFPSVVIIYVCFFLRLAIGMGCYIFLKYHGYFPW